MKASILSKLERLQDRYEELEALLGVAEVIMDQDKFRAYSKEYAELEDVVNNYAQYVQLQADMEEAKLMLAEDDAEILVLSGEPIDEPIASYGPFVMNTNDEIKQTIDDFNNGKFGYLD